MWLVMARYEIKVMYSHLPVNNLKLFYVLKLISIPYNLHI